MQLATTLIFIKFSNIEILEIKKCTNEECVYLCYNLIHYKFLLINSREFISLKNSQVRLRMPCGSNKSNK